MRCSLPTDSRYRGRQARRALFPNYKAEEIAFYRNTGIFPIMHVVGIKQEIR